jgi:ABC-type multidrug transport system fused ATPase/permease subunit
VSSDPEYRYPEPTTTYAAFAGLVRWYRPYLTGMKRLISWTVTGTLLYLVTVALTPLLVEGILDEGTWESRFALGLVVIIALRLMSSYFAYIGAHRVGSESASRLRMRIFDRALESRISRQQVLGRASIVSRHAEDVDRIAEAVEKSLTQGLTAVGRILQSLVLLAIIEPIAGLAMAVATVVFLLAYRRIGRSLLRIDHRRTEASTGVANIVDEGISTSRLLSGLNLGAWQRRRFAHRVEELELRTHEQGVAVARLNLAADAAGLAGLFVVTMTAVVLGGESLAGVAAAILYVVSVVVGLETLPPWVRAVQLGVVSQRRIDVILNEPDRVDRTTSTKDGGGPAGLAARGLSLRLETGSQLTDVELAVPRGAVLGVVSSPWPLADGLVAALAGDQNPDAGDVTLDGTDIRSAAVRGRIAFVPDETAGFDVSVIDELHGAAPHLSDEQARDLLTRFGLGHLVDRPGGLATPLGPGGKLLSVSDRQLLNLAVAVASDPRALLVGSVIPLADADVALPLITMLREHAYEATVMSVRDPLVAEAMDLIAFVDADSLRTGTHQELLVSSPAYSRLWEQRLTGADVDLSVLGLAADDEAGIYTRLVTESYAAGDPVYREGSPADRILFVISGQAAVTVIGSDGHERRTAVLGPGNHCGDLRLTVGETRAESLWAVTPLVVRSLSREAITAGITGLLDRTPTERRIVTSILRDGPGTAEEIKVRLPDVDARLFESSLALLVKDGAVRESDGVLNAVQRRQTLPGAAAVLDRLRDM